MAYRDLKGGILRWIEASVYVDPARAGLAASELESIASTRGFAASELDEALRTLSRDRIRKTESGRFWFLPTKVNGSLGSFQHRFRTDPRRAEAFDFVHEYMADVAKTHAMSASTAYLSELLDACVGVALVANEVHAAVLLLELDPSRLSLETSSGRVHARPDWISAKPPGDALSSAPLVATDHPVLADLPEVSTVVAARNDESDRLDRHRRTDAASHRVKSPQGAGRVSRRLAVHSNGQPVEQGTAWYVGTNVVCTAFHVVGSCAMAKWAHELDPGRTYWLDDAAGQVALKPLAFCAVADVALMTSEKASADVLGVAREMAARSRWESVGYPGFNKGAPFTIHGTVSAVVERESSQSIQLHLDQGTDVDWAGMSGSAVLVEGKATGVVTSVTRGANTAWAAPAGAVWRVLELADIISSLTELLPRDEPLLANIVGVDSRRALSLLEKHSDERVRVLSVKLQQVSQSSGAPLLIDTLNATDLCIVASKLLAATESVSADTAPALTVTLGAKQCELRFDRRVASDIAARQALERELQAAQALDAAVERGDRQPRSGANRPHMSESKLEVQRLALLDHLHRFLQ